jgi:hypothetical protein
MMYVSCRRYDSPQSAGFSVSITTPLSGEGCITMQQDGRDSIDDFLARDAHFIAQSSGTPAHILRQPDRLLQVAGIRRVNFTFRPLPVSRSPTAPQ